ncbi:hypothetical protein E1293_31150 [Actinomadura darangshiensis]|uniref:GAF domain-containing protein n=1 Tax=Actinomadura darangshiensis TaxID=705336 RepID=A0A4R5APC4_9ACTN|nr:hypothetical protein [Actinomadura darangshiensis]TDD73519.1 hypothetical protein E1293_31150 [Actinomadura darangshiensis]
MKRSSVASASRLLSSVVSAILLGIWINVLTEQRDEVGYLDALRVLGYGNLLLLGGIVVLAGHELLVRRLRKMEFDDLENGFELLRQGERRMLQEALYLVCALISKTLSVPCNARYFRAITDDQGETCLEQDRELVVLNIAMPREYGFTRVDINTPHIVSARAYRERVPLYEKLPVNHTEWYAEEIGRMIEPTQRWVLACPVLSLDPLTNRHDDGRPPHGVIVFYGTQLPPSSGSRARIAESLGYAQKFADYMCSTLNALELTRTMEGRSVPG